MRQVQTTPASLAQEALLGQAAAAAGTAVLVSDDTLRWVAVNSAACKLLGYTRDQLLLLRVTDIVERPDSSLLLAARDGDGKIRHGTTGVRRKDGRSFPVQYVSAPATVSGLPYVLTLLW
ncbi:MAG: PAS domain S-box protein [Actinobacteria bacterium]|nr:PAS domain S-box protein [Actinomycetota bacterium]